MRFVLFAVVLLVSLSVFPQSVSAELLSKTPMGTGTFVGVDKFGAVYTTKGNTLFKKTDQGDFHFADLQLGAITSVDILNPLKIVVFYSAMNTVVLLDDKLSEISRVRFNTLPNFRTVGFATKATQNSLWIFNTDLQELERFDYRSGEVVAHTQPVGGKVIAQKSDFNFCWLLMEKKLKCYNSYGSFMQELPAEGITKIGYHSGSLLALKDGQLEILLAHEKAFKSISLPKMNIVDFYLTGKNLYIYDGEYRYTFKLKLPN